MSLRPPHGSWRREAWRALPAHRFVPKTDVKAYYESIDQERLVAQLAEHIEDRGLLDLLSRALRRTITWGGLYWDGAGGLARSCPLSPQLGAFYLHALDTAFEQTDCSVYVRYMDDVLVLPPTHGKLRRAVRVVNRSLKRRWECWWT